MKKIFVTFTSILISLLVSGCSYNAGASDPHNSAAISKSDAYDNNVSTALENSGPSNSGSEDKNEIIQCFVFDEKDFAFKIDFDIHEDSIQYIDIDEEIFGVDRYLDENALRFDILFTIKDEFKEKKKYYNKCTYTVHNNNNNELLASETLQNDEVFRLKDCSIDSSLIIKFVRESDEYGYTAMYGGNMFFIPNWDDTITSELRYMILSS